MSDTVLKLQNVTKTYRGRAGQVQAIESVSLAVEPGEFVSVQGPSGCGKTTLLLIAGGLLRPDAGQVALDGRHPYDLAPEDRARLRADLVGFVFQRFHLMPYLTVLDNVLVASLARPSDDGVRRRAVDLIEHVGLGPRTYHVPGELSTGERQRVAIARALLNQPKVLLADEPTGNLDPASGDVVLQHLADFAEAGGAVLLVTHDERAARYPHRTVRMASGRIRED